MNPKPPSQTYFHLLIWIAFLMPWCISAQVECPEALSYSLHREQPENIAKYLAFQQALEDRQLAICIQLGGELIEIAEQLSDYELLACLYPKMNALYTMQESVEQAIKCAESYQRLPQYVIDSVELIKQQSFLSETYSRLDLWEEAYRYHLEAERNAASQKDPNLRAMVAYRTGSVYFGQGKHTEALAYYEQALQYATEAGRLNQVNQIYGALTVTCIGLADTTQAMYWNTFQKQTAQHPAQKGQAAFYAGRIAMLSGQPVSAETKMGKALQLFKKGKQFVSAAEVHSSLADLFLARGDKAGATQHYIAISKLPDIPYAPWVAKADRYLAKYYEQTDAYDEAYFYSSRANLHLEEQVASAPGEKELEALKVKHLLARNETALRASELESQLYAVALIAVLVILSMLALAFWASRRAHNTTTRQKEQIESQNRQLIAYNERLENFNRVVSHDLKQPLRTAGSLLALIRRRYHEQLETTAQADFKIAEQAVARGHNLVESLLQLTRLERLEPEDFDWLQSSEPLTQALAHLQETLHETKAKLTIEPALTEWPVMYAFGDYLALIWQNLLANACKFVQQGDHPIIHISYQTDKHHHRFIIADHGIGIPEKGTTDIFAMFNRSVSRTQYEGSGIGLSTCKRIVELHGGRIDYQPNGEQGTIFFFTIPKKPHHQPFPGKDRSVEQAKTAS